MDGADHAIGHGVPQVGEQRGNIWIVGVGDNPNVGPVGEQVELVGEVTRFGKMPVEVLNPEGLTKPAMCRQVAIATGSRLVFIAGQVARDATGNAVGAGDLAAQTERVFRNVAIAVEAAGGRFADIAKLNVYVVDWSPEKMAALGEGAFRAAAVADVDPLKPITLIGVAALGEPDLLIEIEATAVLA